MKVSSVGTARLTELREQLDRDECGRRLIVAVDGGFTNRTVFRNLPPATVAIGRIRKDAKLFLPPAEEGTPRRGRRRWYGDALPTPEQIRQDAAIPWETVTAFAAGKLIPLRSRRLLRCAGSAPVPQMCAWLSFVPLRTG